MTQSVTLEDGSVHNFPDDATLDEINSALPPPPESVGTDVGKTIASDTLPSAANVGAAMIPGVGTAMLTKGALDWGMSGAKALGETQPAVNLYASLSGNPQISDEDWQNYQAQKSSGNLPDTFADDYIPAKVSNAIGYPSTWVHKAQDEFGLNHTPETVPGRIAGQTMEGASLFGKNAIPAIAPMLTASSTGEAANAAGLDPLAQWSAETLAGKVGSTIGGKAYNMAQGVNSPILQAYQDANVTPRLVGDVTGSPTMQLIQGVASKLPLGAGQIENAARKTLDEFGNSIEDTASKLGKSTTLQEAGNAVQDAGQKWLTNFKDKSTQMHTAVNNAVGSDTPVPLSNTSELYNTLQQTSNNNPQIQSFLSSPLMTQFGKIIDTSSDGTIPWQTSRALKTRVGQYLENPDLISDAGAAQARQLYSALSLDQQAVVSPKVLPLFDAANQFTSQGHDFIENVLGKAMKQSPEQAAQTLLQSGVRGGTQLQALRQQMPDAADELAAASIRRLGAGESNGSSENAVSPLRWLSNQDPVRRLSSEAHSALFSDPEVQDKMTALDTVASSMRASSKFANPSGSAGNLGTMMALSAPVEGAIAGGAAGGSHGAVIGALAGSVPIALGVGTGLVSTSPTLGRFLSTPKKSLIPEFGGNKKQSSKDMPERPSTPLMLPSPESPSFAVDAYGNAIQTGGGGNFINEGQNIGLTPDISQTHLTNIQPRFGGVQSQTGELIGGNDKLSDYDEIPQKKAKGGLIATDRITHPQFVNFIKKYGKKMGYTLKDKVNPTAVEYAIMYTESLGENKKKQDNDKPVFTPQEIKAEIARRGLKR